MCISYHTCSESCMFDLLVYWSKTVTSHTHTLSSGLIKHTQIGAKLIKVQVVDTLTKLLNQVFDTVVVSSGVRSFVRAHLKQSQVIIFNFGCCCCWFGLNCIFHCTISTLPATVYIHAQCCAIILFCRGWWLPMMCHGGGPSRHSHHGWT